MMLSKESEQFLGNLRAYLMTTGKRDQEVLEIVEELESHLKEAEVDGKSVDDIIGKSPKAYMESIANEMQSDVKRSVFTGLAIILGALSIAILPEIVGGELTFTLFKLVGMLLVFALFTVSLVVIARKLSAQNSPSAKVITLITLLLLLQLLVFIGIFLVDDRIASPLIELSGTSAYAVGAILLCLLIGLSIWSKSWIMLIVLAVIILPDLLQKFFHYSDVVSQFIMIGLIFLMSIGLFRSVRKNTK